jgi:hypothetical protein
MEYTVTLSLVEDADSSEVKAKLDSGTNLLDQYSIQHGKHLIFLLTHKLGSPNPVDDTGVQDSSVSLNVFERPAEDLIALYNHSVSDYSILLARIFADPYNTPTLVTNPKIFHGFKFEEAKTRRLYNTPEDLHQLLAAFKQDLKVSRVYKKTGEHAAAADDHLLLTRVNEYYPTMGETLRPFKPSRSRTNVFHTLPVTLRGGRIMVDNTFKPKTITVRREYSVTL